jgi:hypothetical protein
MLDSVVFDWVKNKAPPVPATLPEKLDAATWIDDVEARADVGGAVYVKGGTPSFLNCTFTSNIAWSALCCHVDVDLCVLTFK